MVVVCIVDYLEEDNEGIGNLLMEFRDIYRNVKIVEMLLIEQRVEFKECLNEYSVVLINVFGRILVLKYSVIIISDILVC